MTTTRSQLIEQMHTTKAMRDLEAMTRATREMTRRADALLQSVPDAATVDQAVREALTRDGALPASAHRPAPGASAPLPRQSLQAALATANAGVEINLRLAHQAHRSPQDAPTATPTASIGVTRESATPGATQPRYGGAPALDTALPTLVNDAVGAMFGLSPAGRATAPRQGG